MVPLDSERAKDALPPPPPTYKGCRDPSTDICDSASSLSSAYQSGGALLVGSSLEADLRMDLGPLSSEQSVWVKITTNARWYKPAAR